MAGCEGLRAADVECRTSLFYQRFQLGCRKRRKFWQLVHRGSAAAVNFGVLGKIFGPGGKVGGQLFYKFLACADLQCVIGEALSADGRRLFRAHVPAAQ